ncbi:MAG: hypothetical protein AAGD07_08135 [Planctomycetota bacterium]
MSDLRNVAAIFVGFAVVGCLITGCSRSGLKTHPVEGMVRFEDGTILTNGSVEFMSLDSDPPLTATGEIQPDGTFVLGTMTTSDGAIAGRHRVAVIADVAIGTGAERPGLIPESPVPQRYRDFDRSGLEAVVEPGGSFVELQIESEKQADQDGNQ